MSNDKYLEHFTEAEIEEIRIDAANRDKGFDAVMRGKFGQAVRKGKLPGQPMPEGGVAVATTNNPPPMTQASEEQIASQMAHSSQQAVDPESDSEVTFQRPDTHQEIDEPADKQTSLPPAQQDLEGNIKAVDEGDGALVALQKAEQQTSKRVQESRATQSRPTRASETSNTRAKRGNDRVPLHQRNVLTSEQREGYHRHYFRDVDDRLDQALAAGYDFVYKDGIEVGDDSGSQEGAGIDSRVSKPAGGGGTLYLMEIPIELYREDQLHKQERVRATEQDMLPAEARGDEKGNFYSKNPSGKAIEKTEW